MNSKINTFLKLTFFFIFSYSVSGQALVMDKAMALATKVTQQKIDEMQQRLNNSLSDIQRENQIMREISQKEEEENWQVPSYIKNGREMNSILDRELRIIRQLKQFQNLIRNNNYIQNPNQILATLKQFMSITGSIVDQAIGYSTDNRYRIDPTERKELIKELDSELSSVEYELNELMALANLEISNSKRYDEVFGK